KSARHEADPLDSVVSAANEAGEGDLCHVPRIYWIAKGKVEMADLLGIGDNLVNSDATAEERQVNIRRSSAGSDSGSRDDRGSRVCGDSDEQAPRRAVALQREAAGNPGHNRVGRVGRAVDSTHENRAIGRLG